jgi:hypothetical protein
MPSLSDFYAKLIIVIQDKADMLSEPERLAFVLEAVSRYSQDRPRKLVAEIPGDGAAAIEGLNKAAACVVTWAGHGLSSGDQVSLRGITQADWAALNGEHTITRLSADTFSIPVNTSGFALAYDPGTDPGQILALGKSGYDYHLPVDWEEGFSAAQQVEYPAGEQQPAILDDNDWMLYQTADKKVLRFLADEPLATETIRFTYTVRHAVTAGASSIPAADQDAVINLAGALCCYALSRKYAQTSEPTIAADSVNYGSKSGEYAKRGKELEGLYKAHIAPAAADGGLTAASVTGDWDSDAGWGTDRVTHPRRLR